MYAINILRNNNVTHCISKFKTIHPAFQCLNNRCSTKVTFSQKISDNEPDLNEPMKYSSSLANKWQAKHSRLGGAKEPRLWYEPYVILGSLAVFLVYFTILREENDVDANLKMSLYERIEGLEEHQLKVSYQYNLDNGRSTDDIVQRLREIEQAKLQKEIK